MRFLDLEGLKKYNRNVVQLIKENASSGKDATINGQNILEIVAGENISLTQDGSALTISANGVTMEQVYEAIRDAIQNGVDGIELDYIEIVTPPTKTSYWAGEKFNPAGMKVVATYTNGATAVVTRFVYMPSTALTEADKKVTVQYSERGVIKLAEVAITVAAREYFYGFDINLSDSNSATRVSYPEDVDNFSFRAAQMDFNGAFSYGSWPSIPGEKFMPRPCMLSFDGLVSYYLDSGNYAKKEDGSNSDVANPNYNGNAMMEWPKIYTKRWEKDGVYHFRCSDVQVDKDYECWCNYDRLSNQISHFYTPIFFGSIDSSGRLRSISGQDISTNTTVQQEVDAASKNGIDWYIEVTADHFLIQDLLVMMFKNTNLQVALGTGVSEATAPIAPGSMNNRGLFWGSNDKISGVKAFGMENPWGNMRRRMAGWIRNNGLTKIKLTRGTKDGSTISDYNMNGDGYLSVDGLSISGATGNYISGMKTEKYGRIPIVLNGSATTFEADTVSYDNSKVGYASTGGFYSGGYPSGPFELTINAPGTYSHNNIGSALSCKPSSMAYNLEENNESEAGNIDHTSMTSEIDMRRTPDYRG